MSAEAPVLLALGSNIDPESNLPAAVGELHRALGVVAVSRVYECEPVGAPGSPCFLNAAVLVHTGLTPAALKRDVLRPIESRLGRVRTSDPNAPRTIDIDIAVFGDRVVDRPDGERAVPDPDIARLAHLALPLGDLAPGLVPPGQRLSLAEAARRFEGDPTISVRPDVRLRVR